MNRNLWLVGLLVCVPCATVCAQTHAAPYPPFTAKQAELGKELAAKSQEIRKQITERRWPAEPFKIIGNLYFVGVANGEVFLLTSPQGHILMGAAFGKLGRGGAEEHRESGLQDDRHQGHPAQP